MKLWLLTDLHSGQDERSMIVRAALPDDARHFAQVHDGSDVWLNVEATRCIECVNLKPGACGVVWDQADGRGYPDD